MKDNIDIDDNNYSFYGFWQQGLYFLNVLNVSSMKW
jgi:hypothetical protein